MSEVQDQVVRLQKLRDKIDSTKKELDKAKIDLAVQEERLSDLKAKCVSTFGKTPEELPALISEMSAERDKALEEAERLMGMSKSDVKSFLERMKG